MGPRLPWHLMLWHLLLWHLMLLYLLLWHLMLLYLLLLYLLLLYLLLLQLWHLVLEPLHRPAKDPFYGMVFGQRQADFGPAWGLSQVPPIAFELPT